MQKTISTHITAFLVGLAGLIALVHPGFTLPTVVVALVPTVSAILASVIEIFHVAQKNAQANFKSINDKK